ncbi:hypothetical protein BFP70_16165 [Thioclava sp. SK-1]|uniref:hypothetical protein n=1 Tax=Thioclava sp. SK-1 TaxID=1889770 RepID=UPI000826DCE4|nr:hypothetical protein [Thioclava sp. SK-1]OCX60997.1 hypothetical protein BFP70_16165 [Thioclava sp. SK-1]
MKLLELGFIATGCLAVAMAVPTISATAQNTISTKQIVDLGARDLRQTHFDKYGAVYIATLPSGTQVEIDLRANGRIDEIEAQDRRGFPLAEVASLLPRSVLEQPDFTNDFRVEKLELDDKIELGGVFQDRTELEAVFSADGQLRELKRH